MTCNPAPICQGPALQRAVRSVRKALHKVHQREGQSCSHAVLLSSWVAGSAVGKQLPDDTPQQV